MGLAESFPSAKTTRRCKFWSTGIITKLGAFAYVRLLIS